MSFSSRLRCGFSLVEILLSLLILAGTVVALLGGMTASEQLESRARFEDQAGAYAERELELLKSDLLAGRRPPGPRGNVGRFRLPGGWKSRVVWTAPDSEGLTRIVSEVTRQGEQIRLESFLYIPPGTFDLPGKANPGTPVKPAPSIVPSISHGGLG